MSKSNAFESALLSLLFENTAITNFGDAGGLVILLAVLVTR